MPTAQNQHAEDRETIHDEHAAECRTGSETIDGRSNGRN